MQHQASTDTLHNTISNLLDHGMEPIRVDSNHWEYPVPYGDQHGDPLWFSITCGDNNVMYDDGGAVAGLLFSLERDEVGEPALELLSSLAKHYQLVADYDLGLVRGASSLDEISNSLPAFTRVVLTLLTAAPFLGTKKQQRRSMGRRLKSRVQAEYKALRINDYVEQRVQIPGTSVSHWQTDFRWQLDSGEYSKNVFVLTADLDIVDPIRKATNVSGLAMDTMAARKGDDLRIVIDTPKAKDEACQAADLIRQQESAFQYRVYDFADNTQRNSFLSLAEEELLSESAKEWRMTFDRYDPSSQRSLSFATPPMRQLARRSNGHSQVH